MIKGDRVPSPGGLAGGGIGRLARHRARIGGQPRRTPALRHGQRGPRSAPGPDAEHAAVRSCRPASRPRRSSPRAAGRSIFLNGPETGRKTWAPPLGPGPEAGGRGNGCPFHPSGGSLSVRIVRTLEESPWREFVDRHPWGNIFHTPEMFEVFSRAKGHRPELWASTDGNRILALLAPVRISVGSGALRFLTTRAVAYGGMLYDETPEGIDGLAAVLRGYSRQAGRSVLFTELRNLSDLTAVQNVMVECGFSYEDHLNYLIPLSRPVEEVLLGFGRRTRKQIRQGLRRGDVTIQEAAGPEDLGICYDLLKRTYAAARVPLADRSLFEAAFAVLSPLGMIRFPLAWIGETCVAASVELVYKDTVYGWYGGVDRRYVSYTPNELLVWHILRWAAENGYRTYDFGGAGRPDEEYGVRTFKAKFGGQLVNFGRNVRHHAPWRLAVSRVGYSVYQRFMDIRSRQRAFSEARPRPLAKTESRPTRESGVSERESQRGSRS
jgi:serine/alanine adding enzyme